MKPHCKRIKSKVNSSDHYMWLNKRETNQRWMKFFLHPMLDQGWITSEVNSFYNSWFQSLPTQEILTSLLMYVIVFPIKSRNQFPHPAQARFPCWSHSVGQKFPVSLHSRPQETNQDATLRYALCQSFIAGGLWYLLQACPQILRKIKTCFVD